MGYLEHQISEMKSFLDREETRYSVAFAEGPEGTLQRGKVNGSPRYMHSIHDPAGNGGKRYIRRIIHHDPELIRSLATKEYARLALRQVERNKHYVNQLCRCITDVDHDKLIANMKSAYRLLPPGCFTLDDNSPTDLMMQREWAAKPYEMSDYRPEGRNKSTSRGLRMRSKSEVLLAEKLYEYGIPFRYEQMLRVGTYDLAPDFTFLDSSGKEFYLEYCGMMDDPGYVDHYIWKRNLYESAGITEWTNMIYVYETGNEIHLDDIDEIIRGQILSRM